MRMPAGARFYDERRRFELRHCCEDCTHFSAAEQRCAHAWPIDEHRRAPFDRQEATEVVFCKEFELR